MALRGSWPPLEALPEREEGPEGTKASVALISCPQGSAQKVYFVARSLVS